jgi:trans-2-enoyl-CoA reductase
VRDAGGDIVLVDGQDLATRVLDATDGAAIRLGIDAVSGTASGRLADTLCESATLVSGHMGGEPCQLHQVHADRRVGRVLDHPIV